MNTELPRQPRGHAFDYKRAIATLLRSHASTAMRRDKIVSEATKTLRGKVTYLLYGQLAEMGYRFESLRGLKPKHVEALVRRWEDEGLTGATLQTRHSILRWLARALNKEGMIFPLERYLADPALAKRRYVALQDKSWSAKDIDVLAKIEEIRREDPLCALHLELAHAFGMRQKECVALRPFESHDGDLLYITRGTKGGRDRVVPVETDYQREVLERAKSMANGFKRSLCARGVTIQSQTYRLQYMLRKHGLTKNALGVTMHGLRAQKACDLKEQLTGVPAPVRGGGNHPDPDVELLARLKVSEYLGHTRPQITTAYYGSTQKRFQPKPPVDAAEERPAASEQFLVHMTLDPGGAWRLDIPTTWLPGASQSVGILPAPMGVPPDE